MKIDGTDAVRIPVTSQSDQSGKVQPESKPISKDYEDSVSNYQLSASFIRKAVGKANEAMAVHNRSVQFKVHERTNEIIVRVVDSDTNEVIREIPSEKILDMVASMLEQAGLLVDERR